MISSFQTELTNTLIVLFFLFFCLENSKETIQPVLPKPLGIANLSSSDILNHLQNLIQFTELNVAYENSRIKARDYIVEVLTSSNFGFSGDQILYHKFDWTDTSVEYPGSQEEIVSTTWSGVNILVWTNTSVLPPGTKFSVVGARYDSQGWWTEYHGNTYPCTTTSRNPSKACLRNVPSPVQSTRAKAIQTAVDLMGACVLLQLARQIFEFQQELKDTLETKSALELLYYWDKKDPRTIETGIYEEIPILFIFFDQEAVGHLGSQVWSEYYSIAKHYQNSEIVSLTALDLIDNWKPFDPLVPKDSLYPSTWKQLAPSFFLDTEWITTLLTPRDELELKESIKSKEL